MSSFFSKRIILYYRSLLKLIVNFIIILNNVLIIIGHEDNCIKLWSILEINCL